MSKPSGQREDLATRRLKEASKYVSRSWLPATLATHRRIIDLLNSDDTIRFDHIQKDLRSDFSLFAHILRSIPRVSTNFRANLNPVELLSMIPHEKLKELFEIPLAELSPHDLNGIKDVQLARVRHSVISCTTVATLAKQTGVDKNFAHACALLRQLGHLLVAWNYQSSCVRAAVNATVNEQPFETELVNILQFNPQDVGIEVAAGWTENPDFIFGLGLNELSRPGFNKNDVSQLAHDVLEFCEIGETLAQINDPQNYPTAADDWKTASKKLTHYLGPKGTNLIRDSLEDLFPAYAKLTPSLFPPDLSPERASKVVNVAYAKQRLEANQYVRKCGEEIASLFVGVYDKVLQAEASMEALSKLIAEVIPKAGFFSGCVYILDPNRMVLVPRLKLGNAKERLFKPISCSCGGERSHPVSEAFQCSTPIKEENVILNGDVVSHVTGKFGNGDKIGILYLEFPIDMHINLDSDSRLICFKAIRHCLADCLNMR